MLTNKGRSVLYIGVTNDLLRRVWEHKNGVVEGFSSRYHLHNLVYYEIFQDELNAIKREKQLKRYRRAWKEEMIDKFNPLWRDLYDDLCK